MIGRFTFDEIYEDLIVKPSTAYREDIGPPVHLEPEAFDIFLSRLKEVRGLYPNMAFWQIIDYKTLDILHSDGIEQAFGRRFASFKDFFRQVHPDYIQPYLRWRTAAFGLIHSHSVELDPLNVAYRFGLPLRTGEDEYYWYTMNSTIVQIDAQGKIVTTLQTFYREMKWSKRNLRPVEASLSITNGDHQNLEGQIITQLSLQLIDEFTNTELDLLSLYAAGKTPKEILTTKTWSKHTLHEYNANILRKAKLIFVYDFGNARNFAEYCKEKGFIQFR